MRKTRGGWGGTIFPLPPLPFPSRARLIFALLFLVRPHYTIWEPSTGYLHPDTLTLSSEHLEQATCPFRKYLSQFAKIYVFSYPFTDGFLWI